jgi:hypothetical protein
MSKPLINDEVKKWLMLILPIIVVLIAALLTDYEGDFTAMGWGFVDPLLLMAQVLSAGIFYGLYGWLVLCSHSWGASTNRGFHPIVDLQPAGDSSKSEYESTKVGQPLSVFVVGVSTVSVAARPFRFIVCPTDHVDEEDGDITIMTKLEPYTPDLHPDLPDDVHTLLAGIKGFDSSCTVEYGDRFDASKFGKQQGDRYVVGPAVDSEGVNTAQRSLNRQIYELRQHCAELGVELDKVRGAKAVI